MQNFHSLDNIPEHSAQVPDDAAMLKPETMLTASQLSTSTFSANCARRLLNFLRNTNPFLRNTDIYFLYGTDIYFYRTQIYLYFFVRNPYRFVGNTDIVFLYGTHISTPNSYCNISTELIFISTKYRSICTEHTSTSV